MSSADVGNAHDPSGLEDAIIETSRIKQHTDRALVYLASGFPIHFRGSAGTGKTTLALHVAGKLSRPITMIGGDASLNSTNLLGSESRLNFRSVVDKYISSVTRVEIEREPMWVDKVLTTACREGHVLVYDEFNRSHAETNNPLLSVLEEKILLLPSNSGDDFHMPVHPEFRAIFTSNPGDYAGTHDMQDALLDRMITIDLDHHDRSSEIEICAGRSGLDSERVSQIIDIVRDVRKSGHYAQTPTLRAGITIAHIVADNNWDVSIADERFVNLVMDVLTSKIAVHGAGNAVAQERERLRALLYELVAHYCPHTLSRQKGVA